MKRKTKRETDGFPRFITDLPEAHIQFNGVRGWISQGDNHQVVFFDIAAGGKITEHFHETPQWGVVVEGEMELTNDGESKAIERTINTSFQRELDTQRGLEVYLDQLISPVKKTGANQKTAKNTIN